MSQSSKTKLVWQPGDTAYINGRHLGLDPRIMYRCRVLETGSIPDRSGLAHDFTVMGARLEITHTTRGLDGKTVEKTWTHGKPVPCSALKTSQY